MGDWEWLCVGIISSEVVGLGFLFKAKLSEYKMTWALDQIRGEWHALHTGNLPTPVGVDAIFHPVLSVCQWIRPWTFS